MLEATGADRVHVERDADDGGAFYRSRAGSDESFRVSRSLIEQVRKAQQVVHVPVASSIADIAAATISEELFKPSRWSDISMNVAYHAPTGEPGDAVNAAGSSASTCAFSSSVSTSSPILRSHSSGTSA